MKNTISVTIRRRGTTLVVENMLLNTETKHECRDGVDGCRQRRDQLVEDLEPAEQERHQDPDDRSDDQAESGVGAGHEHCIPDVRKVVGEARPDRWAARGSTA
jgi:hypothetical protein